MRQKSLDECKAHALELLKAGSTPYQAQKETSKACGRKVSNTWLYARYAEVTGQKPKTPGRAKNAKTDKPSVVVHTSAPASFDELLQMVLVHIQRNGIDSVMIRSDGKAMMTTVETRTHPIEAPGQ